MAVAAPARPIQLSRKEREFARREREILDAALSLFDREDWHAVTVDEIARESEVSKGTIYKHFESKDEIYANLAMRFQQQMIDKLKDVDASQSVVTRFRQFTRIAWAHHLSSHELHRVLMYCGRTDFRNSLPARAAKRLAQLEEEPNAALLSMFMDGVAQKLFPDKPVTDLMFGPSSAFWGAIQLVWSGHLGEVDADRLRDSLTDFILAGMIGQDKAPSN